MVIIVVQAVVHCPMVKYKFELHAEGVAALALEAGYFHAAHSGADASC